MIVTGSDGYAVFQVSDGSTFEVFPNSRVTFRANPANLKDILDVWLGRVKVHIEKFGGQPNNNRVITPTAVISVRGTVFDVSVEDQESTLVAVEEGLVEVQHALLPTKTPKLVNPGESLRVYRDQPLAQRSSPPRMRLCNKACVRCLKPCTGLSIARPPVEAVRLFRGGGGGVATPGGVGGAPGDVQTEPPPPPPPPPRLRRRLRTSSDFPFFRASFLSHENLPFVPLRAFGPVLRSPRLSFGQLRRCRPPLRHLKVYRPIGTLKRKCWRSPTTSPVLRTCWPHEAAGVGCQGRARRVHSATRILQVELSTLLENAWKLAKDPERLSLALDTLFRMDSMDSLLTSLQGGIRRYQGPSLADDIMRFVAENSVIATCCGNIVWISLRRERMSLRSSMPKRSVAGRNSPVRTRLRRSRRSRSFEGEVSDRNPGIRLQHL